MKRAPVASATRRARLGYLKELGRHRSPGALLGAGSRGVSDPITTLRTWQFGSPFLRADAAARGLLRVGRVATTSSSRRTTRRRCRGRWSRWIRASRSASTPAWPAAAGFSTTGSSPARSAIRRKWRTRIAYVLENSHRHDARRGWVATPTDEPDAFTSLALARFRSALGVRTKDVAPAYRLDARPPAGRI